MNNYFCISDSLIEFLNGECRNYFIFNKYEKKLHFFILNFRKNT